MTGIDDEKEAVRERVWALLEQAQVLKVVPDPAQLPVRVLAPDQGKLAYMAAHKPAAPEPFYVLDPRALGVPRPRPPGTR
jgi:5-formyltetrahydrofolate cyclo-ligase